MRGLTSNRSQDYPAYRPGIYTCIVTSCLNLIIVGLLSVTFYFENQKAERGEKELEAEDVSYLTGTERHELN